MKDLTIIPIVDDTKVLVNIIGNRYEFYRTAYEDDDYYQALFNFCEIKNLIVRDVHEYPQFEYDGMVMYVKCTLDDNAIEVDKFKNFILLDKEEVFDALADETITGLLDYLLFEKLYITYLK